MAAQFSHRVNDGRKDEDSSPDLVPRLDKRLNEQPVRGLDLSSLRAPLRSLDIPDMRALTPDSPALTLLSKASNSPGTPRVIPTLAMLHIAQSGDLLVALNPATDPALCKWLDVHTLAACKIDEPEGQLRYLVKEVGQAFRYTGKSFRHPNRDRIFHRLLERERDSAVLLGDFIENGTGVCRHAGVLLQLACQLSRITSVVAYGEVASLEEIGGVVKRTGRWTPHLWNLVAVGNQVFIADTERGMAPVERWPGVLTRDSLCRMYLGDGTRIHGLYGEDRYLYRSVLSAMNSKRELTPDVLLGEVASAVKNSIQRRD